MKRLSDNFRRSLYLATILGGLIPLHPAFSQIRSPVPSAADPGRVLENQKAPVLPSRTLETEEVHKKAVAVAPQGADKLKFVLRDLTVDNMTAYRPSEISKYYISYIGQEISVAKLFDIMSQIQQKYLDDGYALTKVIIPNQNIKDGHVHLSVIEGHVSSVEIDKDIPASYVIDDAARQIREMHPLNVKKLERIMLIINDLPNLNASAVLANAQNPSDQADGGVRLIIKKNPKDIDRGGISLDDYGSVFTGPLETKANVSAYDIGPNFSELSISGLVTAPIQEQTLVSSNYTVPVFGASGTKLTFSASKALTEPGDSLGPLDIKGQSQNYEAGASYPIIRQRDMTLTADGSFEWKNARTKLLGEELYDDRLRIIKTGVNFNFTDNWAAYNVLDVHYSKGLDMMGVRESGSDNLSRAEGRTDFTKFEFVVGRLQALPHNFELFALMNAQYSHDPLLSSEEFGFGGGQVGRGYDASEITGDKGFSASLELRYRTQVKLFDTMFAMQPYGFYDFGKVWNIDPGAKNVISAASTGAGVRVDLEQGWSTDLNLAVPLTKPANNQPKYQDTVGSRILFSLSKSF